MSAAYERVVTLLAERTGYTPRGHGYQREARCPAHEDRSPSLSVGLGRDGAVLLHCQAGCAKEDVWASLDLLARDLFEPKEKDTAPVPDWMPCTRDGHQKVAEYLYTDEDGRTLFGVVRCDRKCFRQWRPDPTAKSGRRWRLKDDEGNYAVRRVPYRLPQLLDGVRRERTVWVCEGEKDVLSIISRPGMVATCSPMGAGKWLDEYAQYFRGADVTICADNDDPGKRHANDVFRSLQPVVRSLMVVLPRFGKDATDHFEAGGHTGNFEVIFDSMERGNA